MRSLCLLAITMALFLWLERAEMTVLKSWKLTGGGNINDGNVNAGEEVGTKTTDRSQTYPISIDIAANTAGYKVILTFDDRDCDGKSKSDIMAKYGFSHEANAKDDSDSAVKYGGAFTNALIETRLGPDEIIIQLEGASFQSQVARSKDMCKEYHALFQVPKQGLYRLKIIRLRSSFNAIRIDNPEFPEINYEVLLDEQLPFELEKRIPSPCASTASNGYWVTDKTANIIMDTPVSLHRPECDVDHMLPNLTTYFRVDKNIETSHCATVLNLQWENRKMCLERYVTSPSAHHHDDGMIEDDGGKRITVSFNYEDKTTSHDSMFIDKKILFVGDSHMRGFADLFLRKVCLFRRLKNAIYIQEGPNKLQTILMTADPTTCTKTLDGTNSCESFHEGVKGLNVSYLSNMLCEENSADFAKDFDYVVINCGHHPASGEHYTYAQYQTSVSTFISNFDRLQSEENTRGQKSRIFWLENTAPPLREDHWVKLKKDWRTYHRLLLFHSIAMHQADKMNATMTVIPAFQSTLAFFDKICDCAHYPISGKLPQVFGLIDSLRLFSN